jgi:hypothetical protein
LPSTMWQQFLDAGGRLRGQALHHILQVGIGIVPIQLGRVHQAHDRGGALARGTRRARQSGRSGLASAGRSSPSPLSTGTTPLPPSPRTHEPARMQSLEWSAGRTYPPLASTSSSRERLKLEVAALDTEQFCGARPARKLSPDCHQGESDFAERYQLRSILCSIRKGKIGRPCRT